MAGPMSPFQQAGRNADSRMASMGVPDDDGMTAEQGKAPMGQVRYRAAEDQTMRCGLCANFDGQMACSKVAGNVDQDATCDLFEPGGPDEMGGAMPPEGAGAPPPGGGGPAPPPAA